jgi:phage tail sheath protein FI
VGSLLRTARDAGEAMTFDPSGEPLWGRVRRRFEDLMTGYWLEGALKGERAEEAFEVRCDRSTMSQQDLDAGRVIASVSFAASLPIERIVVSLASNEGGAASAPAGFSATATGQI